ncbi:MAG TPA: hypothetical protein VND93_32815 [Myxococcales bacterium]|nr:hypothetical protein [Myxococcales bacterium]
MSYRYAIYCAAVVLLFAVVEFRGMNLLPSSEHAVIPSSVRSSPGGYRSYHFWHTGFHGGK